MWSKQEATRLERGIHQCHFKDITDVKMVQAPNDEYYVLITYDNGARSKTIELWEPYISTVASGVLNK